MVPTLVISETRQAYGTGRGYGGVEALCATVH